MDIIILIVIWGVLYKSCRNYIGSGIIYFLFLVGMLLPITLDPDYTLHGSWAQDVKPLNMVAFGLCLAAGFLPWYAFDKWSASRVFYVPDSAVALLERIFFLIILGSLYSLIYLTPYALRSLAMGAAETRAALYGGEGSILPKSIFTTLAVAVAGFSVYDVLFFFVSCLHPALQKYRVWLILSSLSYIANSFAFTARDGLIIIPCFYVVFYLIFSKSLQWDLRKKIKKQILVVVALAGIFMGAFSMSRFYAEQDVNKLYQGTVGYLAQQRHVFDATIEGQDDFWGFECRFPLVNRLLGVSEYEVNRRDNSFEWSFPTMYGEFYDAFAWPGLILMTLVFAGYYYFAIKWCERSNKGMSTLLMFTVYLFIAITGMFYTRAGGSVTNNIFYLTLSIIPFFMPRLVEAYQYQSPTRQQ